MLERTILGNLQIVSFILINNSKFPFKNLLKKKARTNSIQARSEEPEFLNQPVWVSRW